MASPGIEPSGEPRRSLPWHEASRWYQAAAEQGHSTAQFNLGLMYAQGNGVHQDYVTAHMWLSLAAENGNANAAEDRDQVATRISSADLLEAKRRTRVCKASSYRDCD
jgi:uncharacterized protein